MLYKNVSTPTTVRVEDLLDRMTLAEKIAQLTSSPTRNFISDPRSYTFSPELAKEHLSNGCGYIGRVGGATDLLPREMAAAMNTIQRWFVEETQLGIPVLFMTEATSGVLSRNHTLFPQNIGAGAMFNEALVREMADAIRQEMTATGERWALAPVVDVIRDHRYGRYEESFGEDVYLTAQYGKAYVQGLQSDDLQQGVAATLKHFVAQGISDGGRNCGPVHVTDLELLDGYAVPFEAAIRDGQAASVMAAYHEIDQVPVHASRCILTELLRGRLGFQGLTVSDGNGVQLVKTFQEYCETLEDTVRLTLEAGIEVELDHVYSEHLQTMVEDGRIPQHTVDAAVRKILSLKFQLGLFDNPYVDVDQVDRIVGREEHLAISHQMALQSMTLLKNESGLLPLSKSMRSIAVIGPLAHRKEFAYSDYSYPTHIEDMYHHSEGLSEEEVLARTLFFKKKETTYEDLFHPDTRTVLEAIRSAVSQATEVHYAEGLKDTYNYGQTEDFYAIEEAVAAAAKAEVIVAVCGDTSGMGWQNDSGESTDRVEIGLSADQRRLLAVLKELGKPIVLVLTNARPMELLYESQTADAILEAWKPGHRGAEAIAAVLFGDANPAGRLPVTLPKHGGQLPVYYSQLATGKKQFWRNTYLEMDLNPLYEFGYGLSYTTFAYENIVMTQTGSSILVRVDICNTGDRDGEEVVQVYVRHRFGSVLRPERELKAYKRLSVPSGGTVAVEFELQFDTLCYHDRDKRLVLENGILDVLVGSSSLQIHGEQSFRLDFPGGRRAFTERRFTNPARVLS